MTSDKFTKTVLFSSSFLVLIVSAGIVISLVGELFLYLKSSESGLSSITHGILLMDKRFMVLYLLLQEP